MEYVEKKGKVFIKTIPRDTVTNVHEFDNRGSRGGPGRKMEKTKVGMRATDGVMATYNTKTGKLQTGLDVYIENPFKGANPKYHLPSTFPVTMKDADKVLLQHVMEAKHGKPFGFYTDAPPRSGFKKPEDLTFYQSFRYKWNDGSTVLDMSKAEDELAYYMVIANPKKYAPSYDAYRNHRHPLATHFIFIEEEQQAFELSKRQIKNKAVAFLEDTNNKSPNTLSTFVKCLKKQIGNVSPIQAYTLLDDFINQPTNKKVSNAELFVDLYNKFKEAKGKEEIIALALLQDLIFYKVVSARQDVYTWVSTNQIIGHRESEAVEYLCDPNKKPEIEQLKAELEIKLKK